jgi:hypothetical protein
LAYRCSAHCSGMKQQASDFSAFIPAADSDLRTASLQNQGDIHDPDHRGG